MKKRILSVVFAAFMLSACAFGFAACDLAAGTQTDEPQQSETGDNTQDEGTQPGGTENDPQGGEPAVRTTVTEEEWNAAFYENIHNYLLSPDINVTVVGSSFHNDSGDYIKESMEYQVDGNKIYLRCNANLVDSLMSLLDVEIYAEILSRSESAAGNKTMTANVYQQDVNGKWHVTKADDLGVGIWALLGVQKGWINFNEIYEYERFAYNELLQKYEAKNLCMVVS